MRKACIARGKAGKYNESRGSGSPPARGRRRGYWDVLRWREAWRSIDDDRLREIVAVCIISNQGSFEKQAAVL